MRNMFKKKDNIVSDIPPKLELEQIVQLENGERYLVLSDRLINKFGWIDRKEYDYKLRNKTKKRHNVVKIYEKRVMDINEPMIIRWIRL